MNAQAKIAKSVYSRVTLPPRRVFHAKQHGCFTGKLNLLRERPTDLNNETYVGMFDPARRDSYDVVVRFSNGVGMDQHDKLPDVRGAAIKVFDVLNPQTSNLQTVDFLMTNSPTPFGKDFLEFAAFMDLVADYGPTFGGILFASHPRADLSLIKATGLPVISNYKVKSLATRRYWSGHPYLLGENRAMKFNIIPTETQEKNWERLEPNNPNFLKKDLFERVNSHPIKFIFALQLEQDPASTPIEDNLVEWKEKVTPSIPVAELVLDRQGYSSEVDSVCNDLRFTPGHYIPEHRPLSNMGRGRLFGYEASQIGRKSIPFEPDSTMVQHWREITKARNY